VYVALVGLAGRVRDGGQKAIGVHHERGPLAARRDDRLRAPGRVALDGRLDGRLRSRLVSDLREAYRRVVVGGQDLLSSTLEAAL
jgi:hypothetical protein